MKRILLFGELNNGVEEIEKKLAACFSTQLCELAFDIVEGMMKVFEPDLVIINLTGARDYDRGVFTLLSTEYPLIPVITIGDDQEPDDFMEFYEGDQFKNLKPPINNKDILEAVCKRLGLKLTEEGDGFSVTDPKKSKSVLVVDDSPVMLRELNSMLSDDYNVSVATSGLQAMTSIGKHRPDLILLDYEMPVCDGKKTLEMIRSDEDLKDMPVIFLTGVNDKKHLENVLKLKPAGYLLKPADKDKLLSLISMMI